MPTRFVCFVRACSCRTSKPLKSQWLLQAARKAPVHKNAAALCWKWGTPIHKTLHVACMTRHMFMGVTSNTSCNRNNCTIIATTTIYLHPTSARYTGNFRSPCIKSNTRFKFEYLCGPQ
jgi:hypothetical protein